MEKKLYLSDENKFVGGVCGGIGEYLGVDPTAVRLVSAVLTFMTGFIAGIVLYVAGLPSHVPNCFSSVLSPVLCCSGSHVHHTPKTITDMSPNFMLYKKAISL